MTQNLTVVEKQTSRSTQRKAEPSILGHTPEHPLLQAQNIIGNHGLLRLADGTPLQRKLEVSSPTDECELEADRIADEVMRMPEPEARSSSIVRRPPVIAHHSSSSSSTEVPPDVEAQIQSLRGGGQPLSASERAFFEPRFGRDLGDIRIHSDHQAAAAVAAVDARAFAVGHDIALDARGSARWTPAGSRLLAHELTHVVQLRSLPEPQRVRRQTKEQDVSASGTATDKPVCKPLADPEVDEALKYWGILKAVLTPSEKDAIWKLANEKLCTYFNLPGTHKFTLRSFVQLVALYQCKKGIKIDGKVGSKTLTSMGDEEKAALLTKKETEQEYKDMLDQVSSGKVTLTSDTPVKGVTSIPHQMYEEGVAGLGLSLFGLKEGGECMSEADLEALRKKFQTEVKNATPLSYRYDKSEVTYYNKALDLLRDTFDLTKVSKSGYKVYQSPLILDKASGKKSRYNPGGTFCDAVPWVWSGTVESAAATEQQFAGFILGWVHEYIHKYQRAGGGYLDHNEREFLAHDFSVMGDESIMAKLVSDKKGWNVGLPKSPIGLTCFWAEKALDYYEKMKASDYYKSLSDDRRKQYEEEYQKVKQVYEKLVLWLLYNGYARDKKGFWQKIGS